MANCSYVDLPAFIAAKATPTEVTSSGGTVGLALAAKKKMSVAMK